MDAGPPAARADGSMSNLQWYWTCGDPVCRVGPNRPNPDVPACTTQHADAPCASIDARCDPGNSCNAYLLCTDSDPRLSGCPISRAAYKRDIHYLTMDELQQLHDELLRVPLARYHYRTEADGLRPHLGFIIDDLGPSAAVQNGELSVDLYGYASMAVAALQVQSQQLAELQREVRTLRALLERSRPTTGTAGQRARR